MRARLFSPGMAKSKAGGADYENYELISLGGSQRDKPVLMYCELIIKFSYPACNSYAFYFQPEQIWHRLWPGPFLFYPKKLNNICSTCSVLAALNTAEELNKQYCISHSFLSSRCARLPSPPALLQWNQGLRRDKVSFQLKHVHAVTQLSGFPPEIPPARTSHLSVPLRAAHIYLSPLQCGFNGENLVGFGGLSVFFFFLSACNFDSLQLNAGTWAVSLSLPALQQKTELYICWSLLTQKGKCQAHLWRSYCCVLDHCDGSCCRLLLSLGPLRTDHPGSLCAGVKIFSFSVFWKWKTALNKRKTGWSTSNLIQLS